MRYTRQNNSAVRFNAIQIGHHLVETSIGFANFGRSFFRQRFRLLTACHGTGCAGETRERLIDQTRNENSAQQRQQKGDGCPAQPLDAGTSLDSFPFEQEPVFVIIDGETDPEARYVIDTAGKLSAVSESGAYIRLNQWHQISIGWR